MIEKLRIRFRKAGDLRFLSHHDLMRLFERMLRRAGLPFRSTEGFHPKPKMMFASALPLGIVGHQEVIEIEFDDPPPLEEVRDRLAAQALPGLQILDIKSIPRKLNGLVCRATYYLPLRLDDFPDLAQRVESLLESSECWIERTRPQAKRIDIRPYLLHLELSKNGLLITLRVTPTGAARAEEVLQALGIADLLMNGGVLERTELELADEQTSSSSPVEPPAIEVLATADDGSLATDLSKGMQ
jgi:radical SAM-linked protein